VELNLYPFYLSARGEWPSSHLQGKIPVMHWMSYRLNLDMVANWRMLRCAFEWLVTLTPVTRVVNHHHVIYLKHLTIHEHKFV